MCGPDSAGKTFFSGTPTNDESDTPNIWAPFLTGRDFLLASWFMRNGLSKAAIDEYLQAGLDNDTCQSFHSAEELWTLLESIPFGFGGESWRHAVFEPNH